MKNKIALISGGLGDIGSAVALALGKQGVKVALGDIIGNETAASRLKELQREGCEQLHYSRVDVSSEPEVKAWIDEIELKWGVAQIIVANAGIVVAGAPTDEHLNTAKVKHQMNVNFWGSYHLTVNAGKRLKENLLPGRIIFMGSWVADRPAVRISSYCISKAAIRMLCKTLAMDLAGTGILVNEIAPGIVEGGLSKKNQQKDPALLRTHLESIPVGQLTSVEEIARHVVQLSAFDMMSMTGTTILVDGGLFLTSKMTP